MEQTSKLILEIIKCALKSEHFSEEISEEEIIKLLKLSEEQKILPLIYDTVRLCNHFKTTLKEDFTIWRDKAVNCSVREIIQTNEFLTMILHAYNKNLNLIVLKGIVCRDLYPIPYLRPSVDEDILINQCDSEKIHNFLIEEGMFSDNQEVDIIQASELSYHKENSPSYIEMHKCLFDPESSVFGDFNQFFPEIFNHTLEMQIEDVSFLTLEPTYHLLFLIMHSFKHFLYSGFGIRPVCDIGLYANKYSKDINWEYIKNCLIKANAFNFSRAVFHIIENYLIDDPEYSERIKDWKIEDINYEPLLDDLFSSGLHGANTMTRLHSSNITLAAVANDKNKQKKNPLLSAVFLPLERMEGKYSYLKKAPYLLPAAWLQRIGHYGKEVLIGNRKNSSAAKAVALGNQRIELLKYYKIIK